MEMNNYVAVSNSLIKYNVKDQYLIITQALVSFLDLMESGAERPFLWLGQKEVLFLKRLVMRLTKRLKNNERILNNYY